MKPALITFALVSFFMVGCGNNQPETTPGNPEIQKPQKAEAEPSISKNLVGQSNRGLTLAQLLETAKPTAKTPVVGHLELKNGTRIPIRWVGVWEDTKATNEQEFAISLGRVMRSLSATTGNEFCSQICKQGSEWGGAILTIDSGRYCPKISYCPGTDWKHEGQGIHSHRRSGPYVMTEHDKLLRSGKLRPAREIVLEAERASKEDLAAGGWLVGQDALWHIEESTLTPIWDYQREQAGPPKRMENQGLGAK